jgi:hypothetical protein
VKAQENELAHTMLNAKDAKVHHGRERPSTVMTKYQ